jgi:hypothetical protein
MRSSWPVISWYLTTRSLSRVVSSTCTPPSQFRRLTRAGWSERLPSFSEIGRSKNTCMHTQASRAFSWQACTSPRNSTNSPSVPLKSMSLLQSTVKGTVWSSAPPWKLVALSISMPPEPWTHDLFVAWSMFTSGPMMRILSMSRCASLSSSVTTR